MKSSGLSQDDTNAICGTKNQVAASKHMFTSKMNIKTVVCINIILHILHQSYKAILNFMQLYFKNPKTHQCQTYTIVLCKILEGEGTEFHKSSYKLFD